MSKTVYSLAMTDPRVEIEALPIWDKRSVPGGFHVNRAAVLAILARPAPPSEGLREALGRIATMTGDMPAAVNDEAGWYRRQFYAAVGTASRALMVTPAEPSAE